jgi:hypothetical protein
VGCGRETYRLKDVCEIVVEISCVRAAGLWLGVEADGERTRWLDRQ